MKIVSFFYNRTRHDVLRSKSDNVYFVADTACINAEGQYLLTKGVKTFRGFAADYIVIVGVRLCVPACACVNRFEGRRARIERD